LNLVFTLPGEKFFNQTLGSNISQSLFESLDDISAAAIQDEISNTIRNYEPRVNLISVDVSPNYDTNEFNVTIRYYIVGIDVLPQELSFALQSVR
jgi:phage baseplate assembly protein W